jgi:hypothetical protein
MNRDTEWFLPIRIYPLICGFTSFTNILRVSFRILLRKELDILMLEVLEI